MKLTNAGSYPVIDTRVISLRSQKSAAKLVTGLEQCIARGAGNSISDGALNDSLVLSTRDLDKMIAFDKQAGVLVAESGVILADIATSFASLGWFLPTTPGTNQITLGGAVAADVHGKNHHMVGSFGNHVICLDVLTAEQGIIRCSPKQNADLFYATCGGCGLTGIILTITVQMVRISGMWIKQTGRKTRCLAETLDACEEYASSPYTVAWVDPHARGDAMGRGYLMCGDFASEQEVDEVKYANFSEKRSSQGFKLPIYFPIQFYNYQIWTQAINAMYTLKAPKGISQSLVSIESFFYPLQAVDFRIFGGGHITYQFVLPYSASRDGFLKIFQAIVESGLGSIISVLKLFGHQEKFPGNISFPIKGFNFGIDIKVSDQMFRLFKTLDAMVLDHGGRHYLAKDICLSPADFRRGYGASVDEFLSVKAKWDPQNRFRSRQSMRLKLY